MTRSIEERIKAHAYALGFDLVGITKLGALEPAAADAFADTGGLALIERKERDGFANRLAEMGAEVVRLDTLSGLNYSRGKPVTIDVYRVEPVHQVIAPPAE